MIGKTMCGWGDRRRSAIGEFSLLSPQFFYKPETALKYKYIILKVPNYRDGKVSVFAICLKIFLCIQ